MWEQSAIQEINTGNDWNENTGKQYKGELSLKTFK